MSCWTGLNVFDHVRSYDNPFQQTDNHVKLYQKPCARVNSSFAILESKNWNFEIHFTKKLFPKAYGVAIKIGCIYPTICV